MASLNFRLIYTWSLLKLVLLTTRIATHNAYNLLCCVHMSLCVELMLAITHCVCNLKSYQLVVSTTCNVVKSYPTHEILLGWPDVCATIIHKARARPKLGKMGPNPISFYIFIFQRKSEKKDKTLIFTKLYSHLLHRVYIFLNHIFFLYFLFIGMLCSFSFKAQSQHVEFLISPDPSPVWFLLT